MDDLHQRNMAAILREHKLTKQPALYNGATRTYQPFEEKIENQQPTERTSVQINADDQFAEVLDLCREMWNAAAVRDRSNMEATGDVKVDGTTLIEKAPVPFLLYLAKQLEQVRELVSHMPVRDPAEVWEYDADLGLYRSEPTTSHRTQKVRKVLTLVPVTEHQPGQAVPYEETEPVGQFTTTKFTAAWSATTKRDVLDRITRLIDAVKVARTEANKIEATIWRPALALIQYIWPANATQ